MDLHFEKKGTRPRAHAFYLEEENEWFLCPAPVHHLVLAYECVRIIQPKVRRKTLVAYSWTDIKRSCSDCFKPGEIERIDKNLTGMLVDFDRQGGGVEL